MQKKPTFPIADTHRCLALDIGGVICSDTWESLYFAPQIGLVDHYGLDPSRTRKVGKDLWNFYAYSGAHDEEEYWRSFEDALHQKVDRKLIADLAAKVLWTDETVSPLVRECLSRGMQVSLVSNSTSFWFRQQMKMAGLESLESRLLHYLSHETGYKKTHEKGGLTLLAAKVKPETILFVDDRRENIECAQSLGISALHYDREKYGSVASLLESMKHPQSGPRRHPSPQAGKP